MLTRPDPPKSGKIVTRPDPRVHLTCGQLWSTYSDEFRTFYSFMYWAGMTLNSSVVVLIMTLNSYGAYKGMILWVWQQFAPPQLIFLVWSYPTCSVAIYSWWQTLPHWGKTHWVEIYWSIVWHIVRLVSSARAPKTRARPIEARALALLPHWGKSAQALGKKFLKIVWAVLCTHSLTLKLTFFR